MKSKTYSTETNVKICNNLASDASIDTMNKIHEARGAIEIMIKLGIYPPGEYVIARKGLKVSQTSNWEKEGIWGHTYAGAILANGYPTPSWTGDHTSLWLSRTDKLAVFKTTSGNDRYYLALSTATKNVFTS
mgnify:CR=1 FL=1